MLCREYSVRAINSEKDLCMILCYPIDDSMCCSNRLQELAVLGVRNVYSFGNVVFGKNLRVVGKGHAAVVVLAKHVNSDFVALKIRRVDSKRDSLEGEAKILEKVYGIGYSPKLVAYSRNFIVREYIDGSTLEGIIKNFDVNSIRKAIASLVKASFEMDRTGVDILEISNPTRQVVYMCNDVNKPFFIDFESARQHPNPSNIPRIASFIIRNRPILNIDVDESTITHLARQYKKAFDVKEKEAVVNKLIALLTN